MEAAPEALAAVLDHPQAAPLGAVVRCHLLKADHPMGDAVNGLVVDVGRQVVQQQDGRALLGEVVLQARIWRR